MLVLFFFCLEVKMCDFGFPTLEKYFWFCLAKIFPSLYFEVHWPHANNGSFHSFLQRQREYLCCLLIILTKEFPLHLF